MSVSYQEVLNIFIKSNKDCAKVHEIICSKFGIQPEKVHAKSLYGKLKRALIKANRLKNSTQEVEYTRFLTSFFKLPESCALKKDIEETKREESSEKMKTIFEQNTKIRKLTSDVMLLRQRLKSINLSRLNQRIKRQSLRIRTQNILISKLRKELKKILKRNQSTKSTQCNTFKFEIQEIKERIDELNEENEKNTRKTSEPGVFDCRTESTGKPYKDIVREVYYDLISLNVGVNNIEKVISEVLKLVNVKTSNLPSERTVRNFQTELGILTKHQLSEVINSSENLTMHRDATTKKGRHFYGVEISGKEQTYTAALREVPDAKAETYVNVISDLHSEINQVNNESDCPVFFQKVKNSMTDRCATEEKVNKILQTENNMKINSYKCSVHPVLQFQDICEKEIIVIEKENCENLKKDISTGNVIKSTSKLFFKDGTGDPKLATAYIKSKGFEKVPIENFRGNRFNTFFYNALGIFLLRVHIIDYLQQTKTSQNFIQKIIVEGLNNKLIINMLCALAIIYKVITEPYMKMTMRNDYSTLQMASFYQRLIDVLCIGVNDPRSIIMNKVKIEVGPQTESDIHISDEILSVASDNAFIENVVKRFSKVLINKCKKTFADYIEGGKFQNPSENVIKESEFCPQNNITVERLMAKLDSGLNKAPNINIENLESRIIYQNNNTGLWIEIKDQNEKFKIISKARMERTQVQKINNDKRKEIYEASIITINERKRRKIESEERKSAKALKLQEDISVHGIANSEKEIEHKLNNRSNKKEKLNYLKTQINNLKNSIFLHNKTLTQFSKAGKVLGVEELKINLLHLLKKKELQSQISDPLECVGKGIYHIWTEENGNDKSYSGKILSFDKGEFKIKYEDHSVFDVSIDEVCEDLRNGTLQFI